jgi:uncharacterized membrane protein YhaH (DUF805 family)
VAAVTVPLVHTSGTIGGKGGSVNFVDAVKICFVKYADFKGCASRPEFWWWFLFTVVASLALQVVSTNLSGAFTIATFIPSIAVGARRLHDIDRSGWWQLLYLLPLVGWIVLFFFWAEGTKPSRYM